MRAFLVWSSHDDPFGIEGCMDRPEHPANVHGHLVALPATLSGLIRFSGGEHRLLE
jgi:hypothetical protein